MSEIKPWFESDKKQINREKKMMRNAVEVLGFLQSLFEKEAKPRNGYKNVRTALSIAINAIEKQTPKKVVKNRCPVCSRIVGFTHCERCGQRLEW